MNMPNGIDIIVRPDPRRYYRLPKDVQVSDAFRADFDAWAERFFPPDTALNLIPDGQYWIIGDRQAHMNPRTFEQFKKVVDHG